MPTRPFTEQYTLKRDIATRSVSEAIEPRADPALTNALPDDRLIARNGGTTVVVCLPNMVFPSIEYGDAQYSVITTLPIDQTLDEIAASLDAVESMLGPDVDPGLCYYGVLAGSCQCTSNTPERFIADFRDGEAIAPKITQSESPGESMNTVLGACAWPTTYGTFFLTARRDEDTPDCTVRYGLLQHGMPLDTTPIEEFFDAITDDRPTRMKPWPLRQLSLHGRERTPLQRLASIGDDVVVSDSNPPFKLTHSGENPVYGVPAEDVGIGADEPELDVYRSVQSISTLGYEVDCPPEPETYALDSIYTLDMPLTGLCIATASFKRKRGIHA